MSDISNSEPGTGPQRGSAKTDGGIDLPNELPRTAISNALDAGVRAIGDVVSWLWAAVILIILVNVILRYAFGEGRVELEEMQWHLYAVGFLVGLSYCVQSDTHVRVDVFHVRFRLTVKAWIELIGLLVFLVPFIWLVIQYSLPFIATSYGQNEASGSPGGLPYRWAIKSTLLIAFALLALAALARLFRVTAHLFGVPRPLPPSAKG